MFNIIYCELLKLRKSYFYLTIMLVNFIIPIMFFLLLGGSLKNPYKYFYLSEQIYFMFINTPMLCLISAYIFSREFSYKTSQILFCYPQSRTKIFISKILCILILALIALGIQFIMVVLGCALLFHNLISIQTLLFHFKVYSYFLFSEILLLLISTLFSIIFKNTLVPVIYGILIDIINLFILQFCSIYKISIFSNMLKQNLDYIPCSYNIVILGNVGNAINNKILHLHSYTLLKTSSIIICIFIIAVELFVCNLYYKRCDIM
ncbi:ABC-2 type transport system permease protein/bacitracin transport system permease protein [Clostridium acetobutylicum]|uniref:ABC transported MDR-type, permease component n=1 Tax=Clostridium acetobutylicum (strain ATCC 824 / DSM 792 / JCM 1419 / IAM 19013 / LMG 5710 / NBRC 13948 / NRRL B-527 / VKM B-1787 / 2291 / W) TaxID=272562 RepID=Q97HG9_CLOAB|nr:MULTISPECIES: ABC transporter permease [Clostridium]AAK80001.1 ABC transported MDR-type, permease component [Clostridium acetobutylicum ATCC 824]ADZ21093.1 ABC transported MDR-type, permease component [Clostridium acetobutylicum EA 2018]AEI32148.1 ABC transported MDR-type, permease component [Clostridium acetobutylicum DSM 1731]AWV79569.1 ABC transporter permease [Clostridium acetobutylicum]MBC2394457.1 ABC transporter permease subunit [Clostridium acetobutylicum]